jgi:hypothetical protein
VKADHLAGEFVVLEEEGDAVPSSSTTPTARSAEAARARQARMRTARAMLPGHRVATCGWRPSAGAAGVEVMRDWETGRLRVAGAHACGSVWTCPQCAARITESRAADLVEAVRVWRTALGGVAMLTLTIPHQRCDSLADLHEKLRLAMDNMQGHRTWKAIRKEHFAGSVRAAEVTFGAHGWHPHFHVLVFTKTLLDAGALAGLRARISAVWQWAAVEAGLGEPDHFAGTHLVAGVTVDERLAAYVSKFTTPATAEQLVELRKRSWGVERELSKWHTKASAHGLAPFQMLDLLATNLPRAQRERMTGLWLEFATATKGQRQLVWTRGLKEMLVARGAVLSDATDKEVASQAVPAETVLLRIDRTSWRWIVGLRLAQALLDLCEVSPVQSVDFLAASMAAVQDYRQGQSLQFWTPVLNRPDPPSLFDVVEPVTRSA